MSSLSKSILQKIEKEDLRPRSKWYFVARNGLILVGSLIFMGLGIIACGMIFQFMEEVMLFSILWQSPRAFMKLLWFGIPLFWLFSWICIGILGSFLAHETKKGYKVAWGWWVALIFVIQIFGGYALKSSPFGERVEDRIEQVIHRYERSSARGERLWKSPEEGFLGGRITEHYIDEETHTKYLIIENRRYDHPWVIHRTGAKLQGPDDMLKINRHIRIMGEKTGEETFKADIITPGKKPRGEQRRPRGEREIRDKR